MGMMHLSETVGRYCCKNCGYYGEHSHVFESSDSNYFCRGCCEEVNPTECYAGEEAAWMWGVAVYYETRVRGGPEEGGWYYSEGTLTDYGKLKCFENFKEARDYFQQIQREVEVKGVFDGVYRVKGFTNMLPVRSYPEQRPTYC